MEDKILLFDGVCNLCNSTVKFVIRKDKAGLIKFTSLQSEKGQELLKKFNLPLEDFGSFVYIKDGKAFRKSTAALKVMRDLGGVYKALYGFMIIPAPIRDFFYNIVAKSRYKVFGRTESCMVPTPELKERFL